MRLRISQQVVVRFGWPDTRLKAEIEGFWLRFLARKSRKERSRSGHFSICCFTGWYLGKQGRQQGYHKHVVWRHMKELKALNWDPHDDRKQSTHRDRDILPSLICSFPPPDEINDFSITAMPFRVIQVAFERVKGGLLIEPLVTRNGQKTVERGSILLGTVLPCRVCQHWHPWSILELFIQINVPYIPVGTQASTCQARWPDPDPWVLTRTLTRSRGKYKSQVFPQVYL
jgi:hypothetical protein